MDLNPKQLNFCHEYLLTGNGTEAYKKAYGVENEDTARVNASRMLANVSIQAYLAQFRKAMEEKTGVTVEKIIDELSKIAFSDITQVVDDKEGLTVKPLSTLTNQITAAVAEISEQDTLYGKNRKVKMHAKLTALQLLGQHLGMFNDKAPARALPPVTDQDETEHK